MSVSFLKNYYNFSMYFNVIFRSISGTGKGGSVIIFDILEHPKINQLSQSTSTTAYGENDER